MHRRLFLELFDDLHGDGDEVWLRSVPVNPDPLPLVDQRVLQVFQDCKCRGFARKLRREVDLDWDYAPLNLNLECELVWVWSSYNDLKK